MTGKRRRWFLPIDRCLLPAPKLRQTSCTSLLLLAAGADVDRETDC